MKLHSVEFRKLTAACQKSKVGSSTARLIEPSSIGSDLSTLIFKVGSLVMRGADDSTEIFSQLYQALARMRLRSVEAVAGGARFVSGENDLPGWAACSSRGSNLRHEDVGALHVHGDDDKPLVGPK